MGIAWRVQDANNYYLARLDVDGGEQDIALYRIVNGNRVRVDGEDDLELDRAAWHTIKVVQEDDTIRVYLGGIRVLRARDRTFAKPGGVARVVHGRRGGALRRSASRTGEGISQCA